MRLTRHRLRLGGPAAAILGLAALFNGTGLTATPAASAQSPPRATTADQWSMGGQNLSDTRSNPFEHVLNTGNVHDLTVKWTYTAHGDTSATPAVVGGAVYSPDWGGYFSKLNAQTGKVIWSFPVSDYDGIEGAVSRTSPAVVGNVVYIGDQNSPNGGAGAHLMAVSATTGALIWDTEIDSQFPAVVTQSPLVHDGVVYIGSSSKEEAAATLPGYPCCTFRGTVLALDAATGKILWQTYMVPPNGGVPGGYSGASVWSGTPALDPAAHTLYITTGNDYTVPASVTACQDAGNPTSVCYSPDNRPESIVALDSRTGAIKWSTGGFTFDNWTVACLPGYPPNNCPPNPGDDADFADGAHLFTIRDASGRPEEVVGAGQKNGVYWLLDAATGKILWSAAVGAGGLHGGVQWGTATDGRRIYVAITDSENQPYKLLDGQTITYGSFAALDPQTGKFIWQIADPTGAEDQGALTVANGVLYGGSMDGHMYAIDAATGRVLWSYQGEGASNAGPAVAGGTVYWGNGYSLFGEGKGSTTFYAFSLPHGQG
jgi:polyvinyl alcohol dehydrogenase (cytochrome)